MCSQVTWSDDNTWALEPYASHKVPQAPLGIPHAQAFSEGNGNEHRVSYKGYGRDYAQLIQSPTTWSNNAMIINTNKRLTNDTSPGPIGGPQPKLSLAPKNATYQGILECPCTTRKIKLLDGYTALTHGQCPMHVTTPSECERAAADWLPAGTLPRAVNDAALPHGCAVVSGPNGNLSLVFNSNPTSTECGASASGAHPVLVGQAVAGSVQVQVAVDSATKTATVTLTCAESSSWFGVAFNASSMGALPYALIVDSNGKVTERKLGLHTAGTAVVTPGITVVSNTLTKNVRTVVVRCSMTAPTFNFAAYSQSCKHIIVIKMAQPATFGFEMCFCYPYAQDKCPIMMLVHDRALVLGV